MNVSGKSLVSGVNVQSLVAEENKKEQEQTMENVVIGPIIRTFK